MIKNQKETTAESETQKRITGKFIPRKILYINRGILILIILLILFIAIIIFMILWKKRRCFGNKTKILDLTISSNSCTFHLGNDIETESGHDNIVHRKDSMKDNLDDRSLFLNVMSAEEGDSNRDGDNSSREPKPMYAWRPFTRRNEYSCSIGDGGYHNPLQRVQPNLPRFVTPTSSDPMTTSAFDPFQTVETYVTISGHSSENLDDFQNDTQFRSCSAKYKPNSRIELEKNGPFSCYNEKNQSYRDEGTQIQSVEMDQRKESVQNSRTLLRKQFQSPEKVDARLMFVKIFEEVDKLYKIDFKSCPNLQNEKLNKQTMKTDEYYSGISRNSVSSSNEIYRLKKVDHKSQTPAPYTENYTYSDGGDRVVSKLTKEIDTISGKIREIEEKLHFNPIPMKDNGIEKIYEGDRKISTETQVHFPEVVANSCSIRNSEPPIIRKYEMSTSTYNHDNVAPNNQFPAVIYNVLPIPLPSVYQDKYLISPFAQYSFNEQNQILAPGRSNVLQTQMPFNFNSERENQNCFYKETSSRNVNTPVPTTNESVLRRKPYERPQRSGKLKKIFSGEKMSEKKDSCKLELYSESDSFSFRPVVNPKNPNINGDTKIIKGNFHRHKLGKQCTPRDTSDTELDCFITQWESGNSQSSTFIRKFPCHKRNKCNIKKPNAGGFIGNVEIGPRDYKSTKNRQRKETISQLEDNILMLKKTVEDFVIRNGGTKKCHGRH